MCHAHTTDSMLLSKASAIVDCYFQSSVPPKLQLDIPLHIADQVSRKAQGPYLFREAQVHILKYSAQFFSPFCMLFTTMESQYSGHTWTWSSNASFKSLSLQNFDIVNIFSHIH